MKWHFGRVVVCVLVMVAASACAMPLGIRTMMHGRAAVRQATGHEPAAVETQQVWTVTVDVSGGNWTKQADDSWMSGMTADGATNTLSMTVNGTGIVSFRWKTSCEDYFCFKGTLLRQDGLSFSVDGEERCFTNGIMSAWAEYSCAIEVTGSHVLKWSYIKDVSGVDGEDCAWVDGVKWTPGGADEGLATWLAERKLTADTRAANGRTAAECYMLGLDPEDATNDFRIVSFEIVDGKPRVDWEPKTNRWTGAEIQAVLKGAERLEGPWAEMPTAGEAAFRFFKVTVEMP